MLEKEKLSHPADFLEKDVFRFSKMRLTMRGSSIGRSGTESQKLDDMPWEKKNFETHNVLLPICFEELQHAAGQEVELQSFRPTSRMDLFTIGNDFF